MSKAPVHFLAATLAIASLSIAAHAVDIPIGYISYDVTGLNVAEFDIANFTGPNASTFPDTTFPVTNPISLTDLSLTVDFAGGESEVFGSSYFTLAGDGLSFNGEQLSTLSTYPTGLFGADEAVLTGDFSIPGGYLKLNDGSLQGLASPTFSVTIIDPSGLSDGDLGIIYATPTPEPATWTMLGSGLLGLMSMAGAGRRKLLAKMRKSGIALSIGLALLLLPAALKAQVVKLNADTVPGLGSSGTSTVSVTGTGFPAAPISTSDVTVTLSTTCGGAPVGGQAAVSSVTNIIGSSFRIAFVIPGSLAAGNYYVSVSGENQSSVAFSSTNCSIVQVVAGPSPTLTINTTNPTDWVITNGTLTIDFNSQTAAIWSVVPTGTQDQLVDFSVTGPLDGETSNTPGSGTVLSAVPLPVGWNGPTGTGLTAAQVGFEPNGIYPINAGITTTSGTGGYVLTDSYLDFWTDFPTSSFNTYEHFVVTPNDMGIHIYFAAVHTATASAGSYGQIQWVWRDAPSQFANYYQASADLSMVAPVITPLPSDNDMFSSDKGREVQDASGLSSIDLHAQQGVSNAFSRYPDPNSQIPEGYDRQFYVKYNFAGYEYLHKAHGLFGSKYGLWCVVTPGQDTFVGGPQKQNLDYTSRLLTIEPLSDHFTFGISMGSSGAGSTEVPKGVATTDLFGPIYLRINKFGGDILTPDDMYNDAINAAASFTNLYNNETELLASSYVPTTARGSVSIQVNGVTGNPRTAWAVLSEPGVNHQLSTRQTPYFSHQYWADISSTGSVTIPNVVPGTYRLSVYDLGQWGEYRNDSVVVTANHTTVAPTVNFIPENFGTTVWSIATPTRSADKFLHGHSESNLADEPLGYDFREYWGNWNYWADFASTNGAVIYNATDGPNGPATNNLDAWNYTHWTSYDPNLYGGAYESTDDTTDGYNYIIPSYVNTLTGHAGTNGVGTPVPPWQIHFATPANASSYSSGFAVLSLAMAMSQSTYAVSLNGTTALNWTVSKIHASDASERSGLSGFTEWVAFQWPASALNPVGADNVITIGVSGTTNGYFEGSGASAKAKVVANNSDDALRFELTNTSAVPATRGWYDYEFVTSGVDTPANDAVPESVAVGQALVLGKTGKGEAQMRGASMAAKLDPPPYSSLHNSGRPHIQVILQQDGVLARHLDSSRGRQLS